MSLSFRIVCPHCGLATRAPVESFYRWWPNEEAPEEELADTEATAAGASYCPECEGLLALLIKGKDAILRPILSEEIKEPDWAHFQADLSLVDYAPKPRSIIMPETVPAKVRSALPDLLQDAKTGRNAAGNLMLCRAILEAVLKALESVNSLEASDRSPLIKRIDGLRDTGVITASLAEWAHELRLDGNRSAHELESDPRLVRAYADFLVQLIDVSFGLPERIATLKAGKIKASRPTGRR